MTKRNSALIVFVRNPELGKVKTRIAAAVGEVLALEIYLQMLDHTFQTIEQVDADTYLYVSHHLNDFADQNFKQSMQAEGNLGHKMYSAFCDLQDQYQKMVLIGSDCPYITQDLLNKAFTKLEEHDIVLGPSTDGGYYLIAMKQATAQVFENISWSTELVLEQTILQIQTLNFTYHLLEPLTDIDYYQDWHNYLDFKNS